MKLALFSFMILFVSTQLSAQVKTGGGGSAVVPQIESEGSSSAEDKQWVKLNALFRRLSTELVKIETSCTKKKSFPAMYNFIDSFYSLSFKKTGESLDEECAPDKKIIKCLNTEEMQKVMKEINETPEPELHKHLKTEYDLDPKTSGIILKFFTKP